MQARARWRANEASVCRLPTRRLLERNGALDAGDGLAADPDVAADLLDVDAAVAAERGALARDVALGRNAGGDQPLADAGVQAAGDRILLHAFAGNEGADLELHAGAVSRLPRSDDADPEIVHRR